MRLRQAASLVCMLSALLACERAPSALGPDADSKTDLSLVGGPTSDLIAYMPYDDRVRCVEVWGEGWGCEYDNESGGSPWDNPIKNYCALYPETCMFIPSGGGTVANPVWPLGTVDYSDQGHGTDTLPATCPANPSAVYNATTQAASLQWCMATPLDSNAAHKAKVNTALNNLRARGGVCASIATLGDSLVALGRVRVFSHNSVATGRVGIAGSIGGALPANGGASGPESFISISDRLPKFAWDSGHNDYLAVINLESVLAHEIGHLLGEVHGNVPIGNVFRNPSEIACM